MLKKIFPLVAIVWSGVALANNVTITPDRKDCHNTPENDKDGCEITFTLKNDTNTSLNNVIALRPFPQEAWSQKADNCGRSRPKGSPPCTYVYVYKPTDATQPSGMLEGNFSYRLGNNPPDFKLSIKIPYSKETFSNNVTVSNSPTHCSNTPVNGKPCEMKITLTNEGNKDAHHFSLLGFPPADSNSGWSSPEETDCVQNGNDTLAPGKTCSRIFFYKPTESTEPPSGNLSISFLYDFGSEKERTRTLTIPYSAEGASAHVKITSVVNDSKSADCSHTPLGSTCTIKITLENTGDKSANNLSTVRIPEPEKGTGWSRKSMGCQRTLGAGLSCTNEYTYTPLDVTEPCGMLSSSVTYNYGEGTERTATVRIPYGRKDYVCHVNSMFKSITPCENVGEKATCRIELTFTKQSNAGEGKVTDLKISLKKEDSTNGWEITSDPDECPEVNETTSCKQTLTFKPGENKIPPSHLIIPFSYKVNGEEISPSPQQTQALPYSTKE